MIIGVKELEARLDKMSGADMYRGVGRGISLVQAYAKENCPVNDGELREKIYTEVKTEGDAIRGICFTDVEHGTYVEFGTGPRGQENHVGISPDVTPAYTMSPWWIQEGPGENQIDRKTAEKYHFFYIDTPQGRFYQCTGQPAKPFLYPALKNNEEEITKLFLESIRSQL